MPPAIGDRVDRSTPIHSELLEANSMKALRKLSLTLALISFAAVGCSDPLGIDAAQEDDDSGSSGEVVEVNIRADEGGGSGGGPTFP